MFFFRLVLKRRNMKLLKVIPLLIAFFLSACRATAPAINTPTSVPAGSLPDLTVSNVYLSMQGLPDGPGACVPAYAPFEIRAVIKNEGQALALNIPVVELSTGSQIQIGELEAGQSMMVYFPASAPAGAYNVTVDPQNTILESNENNNVFSYIAITPTPPMLCTATMTPSP
jgi:subtilase family serine protease